MAGTTLRYAFEVGKDQLTPGLKNAAEMTKRLEGTLQRMGMKAFNINNIQQYVGSLKNASQYFTQPFVDLQDKMQEISAITGIAGSDLKNLQESSIAMSVKSGQSATSVGEAFKLMASNIDIAALGGVEGLKSVTDKALTLSQAARISVPEAVNAMTFSLGQFKLPASDAGRIMNVLAAGAGKGAAEVADLQASLKQAGSVAGASGVSIEQATGAIEALASSGIKGSEAGVGLRNVMQKMQTEMGFDFTKGSLPQYLEVIKKRMAGMGSQVAKTTYLAGIFGAENLTVANTLIQNSDEVQRLTDAVTGTNAAEEQAAINNDTLAHSIEQVSARFTALRIKLGEKLAFAAPFMEGAFQAAEFAGNLTLLMSAGSPALSMLKWARGLLFVRRANTVAAAAGAVAETGLAAATVTGATATEGATLATWGFNTALLANPLVWVGATIVGVGVLAFALWDKFEFIRQGVYGLGEGIKGFFIGIGESIMNIVMGPMHIVQGLLNGDMDLAGQGLKELLTSAVNPVGMFINAGAESAKGFGEGWKAGGKEWDAEHNPKKDTPIAQAGLRATGVSMGMPSASGASGGMDMGAEGGLKELATSALNPLGMAANVGYETAKGFDKGAKEGSAEWDAEHNPKKDTPIAQAGLRATGVSMGMPSASGGIDTGASGGGGASSPSIGSGGGGTGRSLAITYNITLGDIILNEVENGRKMINDIADIVTEKIIDGLNSNNLHPHIS